VLTVLAENAGALPPASPLAKSASRFMETANKATLTVCPSTCINLGSFARAFQAANPCVCGSAEQYVTITTAATDTWVYLVHALAALALMGLADLWLIMNLSAQFAHAKRDIGELPRTWVSCRGCIIGAGVIGRAGCC